jgi:hypothetical protein
MYLVVRAIPLEIQKVGPAVCIAGVATVDVTGTDV